MIIKKIKGRSNNKGFYCICKCDYCEKEFKRDYFEVTKVKHHFCNSKCRKEWMTGKNNPNWNGGRKKRSDGYICVLKPDHPNCNGKGYIREHRIVMEKYLGRYLTKEEIVHHKNGVVNDNNIENLMLFANDIEHIKYHRNLKKG